jgi:predicted RNase H-like nuclease
VQVGVIAVDMPLGLQAAATPGGRPCDQHARRFVGPRASSVFSPPAEGALAGRSHAEASILNQQSGPGAPGLSQQAVALFPKLKETGRAVAQSLWLRNRIIEVHPEVCFRAMAGRALLHAKKQPQGKDERRRLLIEAGFADVQGFELEAKRFGAATDDALDACAAAWTAWRYSKKKAECFPPDARGAHHVMRIWF